MKKLETKLNETEIKGETLYKPIESEDVDTNYKGVELLEERDCLGGTGIKYWM